MAHPLRLELLELLADSGPLTATEAAQSLGQTPANASWHLRKLAEHGFVEQDASGPGRRRPWRMVAQTHTWGDDAEDQQAASALLELIVDREVDTLRAALGRLADEPATWRTASTVNNHHLWLTAEEARTLSADMFAPVARYAHRNEDAAARPAGARLMAVVSWLVPTSDAPSGTAPGSDR